jgi:hypothetical protein
MKQTPPLALRALFRDTKVWILFALALLVRLVFALLPLNVHLLMLEDDAWMVTAIARNVAIGNGMSADGVHPTNGFHPLYPVLLGSLPYLIAPNNLDFGFSANMVMCALLNALVVFPLFGLLRQFVERKYALLALLLFALNPYQVRLSVNAMESSLALLMLVSFCYYWYTFDRNSPKAVVVLGILAAFATMARLDIALIAAVVGFYWLISELWKAWKADSSEQPVLARLIAVSRLPFLFAIVATIVLIPYFARNRVLFGSFTPSSGRALAYMHSYVDSFALTSGTQIVAYNSLFNFSFVTSSALAFGLIVLMLILGVLLIPRQIAWKLLPIWIFIPIQTCYYAYLQQQGNPRYYVGISVLLLVAFAVMLQTLDTKLPTQVGRVVLPALIVLIVAGNTLEPFAFYQRQRDETSSQLAMYQAARWMSEFLPPEAVIAARNSGIYQYYSEHLVINIDGKLNHEIVPVLEQRGLMDYLRANKVEYVVDLEQVCGYIEFYSHQYSDAPPHAEVSSFDKLGIYVSMALRKLGIGSGPQLDAPVPDDCQGTFTADAPVFQTFPLRPGSSAAVTIFRLR